MSLVFNQLQPLAATLTSFPAVASGIPLICSITACNTGAALAMIRIGITVGASTSYLEYDCPLTAAGSASNVLERTDIRLPAGAVVKVYTNLATVDFTMVGIEEAA